MLNFPNSISSVIAISEYVDEIIDTNVFDLALIKNFIPIFSPNGQNKIFEEFFEKEFDKYIPLLSVKNFTKYFLVKNDDGSHLYLK